MVAIGTISLSGPDPEKTSGGKPKSMAGPAREFEAMLLTQWLQAAENSFATLPGTESDGEKDPGADQFQSLGAQAIAGALASRGGIGIGQLITKYLGAADHQPAAAAPLVQKFNSR